MLPNDSIHPRAKKSLGQNFLKDGNIARKIVDALAISQDDYVVEIGPGPGALTDIIAHRAPRRLVLVEKDEYWADERRGTVLPSGEKVEVLCADALAVRWEDFPAPWKCIGNLPYNVASPLMWDIFSRGAGLARAVFMIQKEVGQRIAAEPGTKAYGALSVWARTFVRPKIEFIVPPQVFVPRPKVDSAVLSFEPRSDVPEEKEREALSTMLHLCFQQRRKQLGTILKPLNITEWDLPPSSGVVFTMRPERLTPEQFLLLSRLFLQRGRRS